MSDAPRFYPKPGRYFAPLTLDRPIHQGDIFRGAFGAFWRHPESVRAIRAGAAILDDPPCPSSTALLQDVLVRGQGYGMLLPQPCEYSEGEKGATHPFRLVAPLIPLNRNAGVDHALVRAGQVGHTIWVPRWRSSGPQDYYADLRLTASVDAAFISGNSRVAALSRPAWFAMADRLSRYFVGIPLDATAFAVQQAHLHPDS